MGLPFYSGMNKSYTAFNDAWFVNTYLPYQIKHHINLFTVPQCLRVKSPNFYINTKLGTHPAI